MDSDRAMTAPTVSTVQAYYDERVEGKLRDFTDANPRIEAAIETLAEWAPAEPRRVLEIGCGIGASSWRMARAWPKAEVIGADISPASIDVANTCFRRGNLRYRAGLVKERAFEGKFDLVLLMDVYEHIALADRDSIHAAIKSLLSDDSRAVITVPTPALLEHARKTDPSGLQPVDEDVTLDDVKRFAAETATDLLYYRKVGIWNYGDFAHLVFGRYRELADVALREHRPWNGLRQRIREMIHGGPAVKGRSDYLGTDVHRPSPRDVRERFKVPADERRRLAAAWSAKRP